MADFSAKHYQIKSEKNATRAEEAADRAESYANNAVELTSNKANSDLSNLTAEGKSLASGLAMPSGKYIDLTLGASGTKYTAPANGWFYVAGNLGKASGNIGLQLLNLTSHIGTRDVSYVPSTSAEYGVGQNICAKKGDIVQINIAGTLDSPIFRFIYAEGE